MRRDAATTVALVIFCQGFNMLTLGGIAHGLGAALLEEFVYNDEGQLITQGFMDYLLPSAHEVPEVEIVHHCTPSPFTVFGQKGSGESGYLGAPAAISGAINDSVASLGISFDKLPIRISAIGDAIAAAQSAVALAPSAGNTPLAEKIEAWIAAYRASLAAPR